ncbi:MAG TPA: hypothetical protein VFB38_18610 [Chthonomonadaceae bacterium]|nr:hypothetical protein [Chthonomonadaceae bacterium]
MLATAASLLPCGVSVTVLAARAFGTPAFTDLVAGYGWYFLVRVRARRKRAWARITEF